MSIDFVVRWKKRRPTNQQLRWIVEDFLGPDFRVTKDGKMLLAVLGAPSAPLTRVLDDSVARHYLAGSLTQTRGFAVWPWRRYVSLTMRRPDEFTMALAEGLAKGLGRFYQAEVDLGS